LGSRSKASGNVVFESKAAPSRVKAELEGRLHAYAGKPVRVVEQMAGIPGMSIVVQRTWKRFARIEDVGFRERRILLPTLPVASALAWWP
jgi:hypothetical protein